MDRCAGAGGVVPALFSSWLWLLLVFTVAVLLAIDGAGVVVVLVVFIVSGSCGVEILTCVKNRGLINFGRWSVIKDLMTLIGQQNGRLSDQKI